MTRAASGTGTRLVVVDGLFLTERMSGLQRSAMELVRGLDRLAGETAGDECAAPAAAGSDTPAADPLAAEGASAGKGLRVLVLVPASWDGRPPFAHIPVVRYGRRSGRLWEQTVLPEYLRLRGLPGLFPGNTVPMAVCGGTVILHDVLLRTHPSLFIRSPRGILSLIWRNIQYRRITASPLRIVTVSRFSKKEIMRALGVSPERIAVIYNSWQHMDRTASDDPVFRTLPGLERGKYVFSLISPAPHKNLRWIVRAARRMPEVTFVAAGVSGQKACAGSMRSLPENLIPAGRLDDGAIRALMGGCEAFLFPSLHEGFGIPPLEAAACGAPSIIVSDIPVMHEVFGDDVLYVDPLGDAGDLAPLLSVPPMDHAALLSRYSWDRSAAELAAVMRGTAAADPAADSAGQAAGMPAADEGGQT